MRANGETEVNAKREGWGYPHLLKKPDASHSNPNTIRAVIKATAVIAPEMGFISATKPSMIAIMPTIIVPERRVRRPRTATVPERFAGGKSLCKK